MRPIDAARKLIEAGYSVIPIKVDGSKSPMIPWKEFQTRIMTREEADRYFREFCGIAIIAGQVSGNLEIIDIESEAPMADLVQLIDEHLPGLLPTLPQVNTPTGGRHILYRCSEIAGNQKLAMSAESKVLIETRGEGGYVLTVTSPPECHPSGKEYTLAVGSILRTPTITSEQREILLSCCRSFNRLVAPEHVPATPRGTGKTPGDDFNARGDGLAVLLAHGWQLASRRNGHAYLRRPGKKSGISATYGYVAPGVLNNFSSNAAPFALGAFDNFGIFARLEADGDFSKAAKMLREQGYGEPIPAPRGNAAVAVAEREQLPEPEQRPEEPDDYDLMAAQTKPTHDNVALVFQMKFKDQLKYCDVWKQWLRWDSNRWKPDTTLLAFDYCRNLTRKINTTGAAAVANAGFARGVETFARASRTFATEPDQWDRDNWLLNTPDGTVDLQTGQMRPHAPCDYLTKVTAVSPAPGPHPIFDQFLRDITLSMPGEDNGGLMRYHQISLGMCLSGGLSEPAFLFWYGNGQNGKSVFGELIAWILGGYAKVVPIETLLSDPHGRTKDTLMANLDGVRLAISSEVEDGSFFDAQSIKSLTGDAMLPARMLYGKPYNVRRTHKHLVFGNDRPQLRVVDVAIRARIHLVPFKADFTGKNRDPEMAAKLRAEAPQILQWLIDGHSLWLEAGNLAKCSAVQAETDSYFQAQSTPDMWLEECCQIDHDSKESAKSLYASYKAWKESRGEGVMSQTRLAEFLHSRGLSKARESAGVMYSGIRLTVEQTVWPPPARY